MYVWSQRNCEKWKTRVMFLKRKRNDCRRTEIRSKRGVGNCHALFVGLPEEGESRKHPCPMCILFQYMWRLWIKSTGKLGEWVGERINFLFPFLRSAKMSLQHFFGHPFFFTSLKGFGQTKYYTADKIWISWNMLLLWPKQTLP